MTDEDQTAPPLAGIRIADFSRVLAGPLATMTLGDLGADVIKIEVPGSGDVTRSWGPPFTDDGQSTYWLSVNRNKRSVALDLRDPDDYAIAFRLATSADVVIENFRAGTMERLGLDHGTLAAVNPGLVYCQITGFGTGDGGDLPGYDFLVQALSGLMSITGPTDGPPMKTGVAIVDVLTGLHASIAILGALHERQQSGRGQKVHVDLMSAALSALVNQASSFLNTGAVPTRMSNRHPSIAPYETFETATAPIAIAVGSDDQFRELCAALELPDAADDPRWATNADRVEHRDSLVEMLEGRLLDQPGEHWIEVIRARGIPCGGIQTVEEAFGFAEALGLEPSQRLMRGDGGSVSSVSNPISFERTPVVYDRPPPDLDEHGSNIDWL